MLLFIFSFLFSANLVLNENLNSIYFKIKVLDSETLNAVPLIMLRTSNYLQYFTDSAGIIAFYEPGMMDQKVFFSVLGDGYVLPNGEGEDYPSPYDSGIVLETNTGKTTTILVKRTQIAERMYRLTGSGLYRDAYLTESFNDIPSSVISPLQDSTGMIGQDTVVTAEYKKQIIWMFGDSACPRSARQNNCNTFGMYTVGAYSCSPRHDSTCNAALPPGLVYFSDNKDGFTHMKPMAPIEPLDQNTWISTLLVLPNDQGEEELFAVYYKNPGDAITRAKKKIGKRLKLLDSSDANSGSGAFGGYAKWNDQTKEFEKISSWDFSPFLSSFEGSHTVQNLSPIDKTSKYLYFINGLVYRVKANLESVSNYKNYESFTPIGVPADCNFGSAEYNDFLNKYVGICTQGPFIDLYIMTSDSLFGPWDSKLVVDHSVSGMSCYNAMIIPHMNLENGRYIHFACTFTAMWSETLHDKPRSWATCLFGLNGKENCAQPVPRYEYNNLIYKVDLNKFAN